jgi:hypothetical protein
MTTIAYHQYCNIPNMSGSYASSPVVGPLTTSKTPLQMHIHNRGVLSGKHPNPPQYYPSDGSSVFSGARQQYRRTLTTQDNFGRGTKMHSSLPSTSFYSAALKRQFNMSQSTKYVAPATSGMYLAAKKSAAVGQSSLKQGLPDNAKLTYKNYNKNDVKTSLKMARSGGCIAPAKKGAIVNLYKPYNPQRATYLSASSQVYYNPPKVVNDLQNIFSINTPSVLMSEKEPEEESFEIPTNHYAKTCYYETYDAAVAALSCASSCDQIEDVLSLVNINTTGDYTTFFEILNQKLEEYSH